MNKTDSKKRNYLRYIAIILIIVLLVSTALLLLEVWERGYGVFPEQSDNDFDSVITYNNQEYLLKDNIETVLILGLDKFESSEEKNSYNNDKQADFLMLLVIDKDNSSCSAIHINRDTMTDINILGVAGEKVGTVNKQIALAHTYGNGKEVSCRNTSDAVSGLLNDIKIDHYISMTMDAVPVINDLVGGVEVTISDDFTGVDDTLLQGETVNLLGEHALNYIRSRSGMKDSSNINRMERQRKYFNGLYDKTKVCVKNDESFIVDASMKISDYIVSDYTISQLQKLFEMTIECDFTDICTIKGESVIGEEYMEFYPDENSIDELIVKLFYVPK